MVSYGEWPPGVRGSNGSPRPLAGKQKRQRCKALQIAWSREENVSGQYSSVQVCTSLKSSVCLHVTSSPCPGLSHSSTEIKLWVIYFYKEMHCCVFIMPLYNIYISRSATAITGIISSVWDTYPVSLSSSCFFLGRLI